MQGPQGQGEGAGRPEVSGEAQAGLMATRCFNVLKEEDLHFLSNLQNLKYWQPIQRLNIFIL